MAQSMPPYPAVSEMNDVQYYRATAEPNSAFGPQVNYVELTMDKLRHCRILIIADGTMPLHVDFNSGVYPDTVFLPFARATLRHVRNLLRALTDIAGPHGFKPEFVLVIGLYEELRHTVSSMLDPADESRLKELDVDMLARYTVTMEQFIKDMKTNELPKTIFVTPPAMNARPAEYSASTGSCSP